MCKHNWIIALPRSDDVEESLRIDYSIEKMLSQMSDIFYCDRCFKSGHPIKSHRGGMRVHYYSEGYFVNKANEIRIKYNLPILKKS